MDSSAWRFGALILAGVLAQSCSMGGSEGGSSRSSRLTNVGEIVVLNSGSDAGIGVADVVLPLHKGDFMTAPRLRTDHGKVCQVNPLGAKWEDGSLRYLRVEAPVDMAANERSTIKLINASEPNPQFVLHKAIPFAPIAFLQVNGRSVQFPRWDGLEDGDVTKVFRTRVRDSGSSLWAELTVILYSGLPHARFYLAWGNSDQSNTRMHENPGNVWVEMRGSQVICEEEKAKVLSRQETGTGYSRRTRLQLHRGGTIADGQSQALEGRFVFDGKTPPRLRAIAKGWASTQAFGPFGNLVPHIAPDIGQFENTVEQDKVAQSQHPWAAPFHGCNPDPRNTGSQRDFGVIVMREDLLLADPARLQYVARSVFQEACRPFHHREPDVSPVSLAKHPNLITLQGRPHWRAGSFVDMLGKPKEHISQSARTPRGHTFHGYDVEHLSINYLAAMAMITGDRWALSECKYHVDIWLSDHTYKTGTWHDRPGATRAVGRTYMAACWLWLLTGDDRLKTRLLQRASTLREYRDKDRHDFAKQIPGVLVPRHSREFGHYWPPWEEGIGVTGLLAIDKLFGAPDAVKLAIEMSDATTLHGYGKTPWGWRVGYKIPFRFPDGKTYYANEDPNFENVRGGSGLTIWGFPAVALCATRSTNKAARERAQLILKSEFDPEKLSANDWRLAWIPVVDELDTFIEKPSED